MNQKSEVQFQTPENHPKNQLKRSPGWRVNVGYLLSWDPIVLTHSRKDIGVYIHCAVDDEGNPDWGRVIEVAQAQMVSEQRQEK